MALVGPQIGGVSLIVHTVVIIAYRIRIILTNFQRRTFHPYHPNAKL